jgi:hypothetical protein
MCVCEVDLNLQLELNILGLLSFAAVKIGIDLGIDFA